MNQESRPRRDGVFESILRALAEDLRSRAGIDVTEGFIDGSLAAAFTLRPGTAPPDQ